MKLEEVLEIVGTFGWYQKSAFLMMVLPATFSGVFMLMPVIILAHRHHRCMLPGYIDDTYRVQNDQHKTLIESMIPSRDDAVTPYEPCYIQLPVDGFGLSSNMSVSTSTMKCSDWVYDRAVFKSTFVSKQHLICDKAHLVPLAMMIFYVGVFVGGIVFGFISDRIGRKKTLFASILLLLVTNLVLTAANNFAIFSVISFMIGASVSGTLLTSYVLSVELLGSSTRLAASSVFKGFFAVGSTILAGVAYWLRDWVYIELIMSLPLLICFTYYRMVDESVRWLIAEGRINEAEYILRKAAHMNGKVIPVVKNISPKSTNQKGACIPESKTNDREHVTDFLDPHTSSHEEGKVWHLFQSRKLSFRTLIIFYLWFGFGIVYYGLTLNTDHLGDDFYLSFALTGLCEIPAYVLMYVLEKRGLGRKTLLIIFFMLSGTACTCAAVTTLYDHVIATLTLAMVGKLGSAGASATVYLYTNEVMPTVVRNSGFGTSASFARLGTIVAPYIIAMDMRVAGRMGAAIPLFTFGGVCLSCSIVTVFLPETVNRELPETIKDAENIDTSF